MIYLVSKIVVSLLVALGVGFGMAWALQMHLAARLREQLNSVIFETKSRIPQLESEITNRDQAIDGLREELAEQSKRSEPENNQQGSKEQEKQIDELRQKVIDLENELRMARNVAEDEPVFEIDEADRAHTEEPELMSDDEFLTDIQDIFEDGEESAEDSAEASAPATSSEPATDPQLSIEEELQNELEGWDDSDDSAKKDSDQKNSPQEEKPRESIDLKAELLELESKIRARESAEENNSQGGTSDIDDLRSEIADLSEARKSLNEIVDTQAKEMASMKQQRDLQDKSLTVLNQQLELARVANERILQELRELKDGKTETPDNPRSATGG